MPFFVVLFVCLFVCFFVFVFWFLGFQTFWPYYSCRREKNFQTFKHSYQYGQNTNKWKELLGRGVGSDLPKMKTKAKAYDTRYSQAVSHPSTNRARCCLTSVIGREPVYSAWYGRRQMMTSFSSTYRHL